MGTPGADAPELESASPPDASLIPPLDVEVATVSMVDGMWQDQPDNVAAFVEARLGDLARGRGNLYLLLDVSGDIEGRSDIERALVEVIRDTYATSRGSISFALSEALRAANAHLFEANRQVAREARRMAGISAVVLRGGDLYIAQAGPAVVYVETNEKLARYPAESDWFVEDAPLITLEGTASAPLGMRREFASDLAHASVGAGDVFVLATRALTQLATTQELAIAFAERNSQEISRYFEDLGQDGDVTALVAEVIAPRAHPLAEDGAEDAHIESLPVPLQSLVSLDEQEPPLPDQDQDADDELDWETVPEAASAPSAATTATAEPELNWADELDDEPEEQAPLDDSTADDTQNMPAQAPEAPHVPIYAAAAAVPMMQRAPFAPPLAAPDYGAEIERRRAERAARRAAQKEGIARWLGGLTAGLLMLMGALGGMLARAFGGIDWEGIGKSINRALNLGVSAVISFVLLLVRLVLPGAPAASTRVLPRRATSDPVWLKALAIVLPVLFIGLAAGRFMLELQNSANRVDALIAQADTIVKQAEANPDKTQAQAQLNNALQLIRDARATRDSAKARAVLYRIQDQLNEIDGVAVLYFLPTLAQLNGADLKQIAAGDQDVYLFDGRGRVYQFTVNDASGAAKPAGTDGTVLKQGDPVGGQTVSALQFMVGATRAQAKPVVVAVSDKALLVYDPEAGQWTASPVQDAAQWSDLRAIASFGGNIYLLDGKSNQIFKYTPTAAGYSAQASPYFPANDRPILNKAVDMAIDGDVWILNDNGTVMRYRAGVPIPFQLGTLPIPLKNPVAIFTSPEVDSLYIADAGNERIVEFDKNGKFVRQFKPYAEKGDVFKNLRDFTVNETKRKLYFINADAAYMANVPK